MPQDKLTAVRIKQQNGQYGPQIPVGAKAENVKYDNMYSVKEVLGNVKTNVGPLQEQIDNIDTEAISGAVTDWLEDNPGALLPTDKTLSIADAPADAQQAGKVVTINSETDGNATKIHLNTTNDVVNVALMEDLDNLGDVIADEFATNKAYAIGQYVFYDGNLYKFTAVHSAGAWNSSQVTQVKIGDEVTNIMDGVDELKTQLKEINDLEEQSFIKGTFTGTGYTTVSCFIPAGTYNVSVDSIDSEDTISDKSICRFTYSDSTAQSMILDRTGYVGTFTLAKDVISIIFYASNNAENSRGKTFSFNNFCISKQTALNEKLNDLETELATKLTTVGTNDIDDGAVTKEKTNFVIEKHGEQLLDYSTMVTDQAWAYTSNPGEGGTVSITSNQYTANYSAFRISVPVGATKISLIANRACTLYSYYFTDADSVCISYEYNVSYDIILGKTLTVPEGAVYLYVTFKNFHDYAVADVMVSASATPMPYEDYETFYVIEGLRVEDERDKPSLQTPDRYELVVGDTFELFYQGIVKAAHYDVLDVVVTCAKGKAFERKYVYTPTSDDIGTLTMQISLYDVGHNLIDSKNISLVIKAKPSNPVTQKVVLYVTDSLGNGGHAPGEFKRRLVDTGGTPDGDGLSNITFIGTCNNGYVDYEGYGGWTWDSYNTANSSNAFMWITVASHDKTKEADQHSVYAASNGTQWKLETIENGQIKIIRTSGSAALPSSGTLTWISGGEHHSDITYSASAQAAGNPFWNENTNSVDFATYATAQGVSSIDYVYVLLGWNGSGSTEEGLKSSVRTFLNNVLSAFPNCKIVLLGLEAPARDGLANNYGASGLLAHYFDALSYVFRLQTWYTDITNETAYNGKVSYVNVSGQFDTQYNMPTTSMKVNTRNSATVNIQSNGVHPLTAGYYQIADACYRDFAHKLQT